MNPIISSTKACDLNIHANQIVKKTSSGVIANVPDIDYFQIKAFSKHHIEPALESGIDYKFFSVDKLAPHCESVAVDDGKLLHCLTLEESEFESRYMVSEDLEELHKEYPLFFRTIEEMKSFISKHNKDVMDAIKELKAKADDFNAIESDTTIKTVEYSHLPLSDKSLELTNTGKNKAISAFKAKYFKRLPKGDEKGVKTMLMTSLKSQPKLGKLLQSFFEKHNGKTDLIKDMNDFINTEEVKFSVLDTEQQLDFISNNFLAEFVTKAVQKKCVDAYLKSKKKATSILDLKKDICELVKDMESNGIELDEDIKLIKITNYGSKTKAGTPATVNEALESIESVYKKKPVLKSEEEAKLAIKAERENKILISSNKLNHAKRIVSAIFECKKAKALLTNEHNLYEQSLFWNDPETGKLCKGKADVTNLAANYLLDVKFVRTAKFDELERDSAKYNFHLQDSFYTNGFNEIMKSVGEELNKFYFIAVEKDAAELGKESKKPIRVRVFEYSMEDKSRAKQLIDGAIFRIIKWDETDHYEGFDGISVAMVPAYQKKRELLLINQIELEKQLFKESQKISKSIKIKAPDICTSEKPTVANTVKKPLETLDFEQL